MNKEKSMSPVFGNELSSSDDDKKFVGQAVAFVIGHTRNGFVSLCAGVASLLKDQAKLRQENEALKQEIAVLKSSFSAVNSKNNVVENSRLYAKQVFSDFNEKRKESSPILNYKKWKRKDLKIKKFHILEGCLCERCCKVSVPNALSAPVEIGEKVVISGEICGTVQYVGHVDSFSFPDVFVGLLLDEAVGDTNGTQGKKTYFIAPDGYGIFSPLYNVHCILK